MLNILKIFWGDLKKISRNAIAWIVVLGLSVVPVAVRQKIHPLVPG